MMRAWQRMLSGRRLDLINPSPMDIEIEDIAHGLARVARWNGQTTGHHPFSVAQHCLIVEDIVRQRNPDASKQLCLAALLHDAPEYVIGDMISPFKAALGMDYKSFEDRLEKSIHARFGISPETALMVKKTIKDADRVAAWFEANVLAGFSLAETVEIFGPKPDLQKPLALEPLPTDAAKAAYLARFYTVMA